MRHSFWLGSLVALTLQACGEEPRLTSDNDPVSSSSAALSKDWDPLRCTLGAECDRWGELVAAPLAQASECEAPGGEVQALAWSESFQGAACSFGRCPVLDAQLVVEPSGTLLTMLRLELPSPMVRGREAGLLLARYEADGTSAGSQLWDYAVPPPGVEVQRHAQLLVDASGDAVLASGRAVLPRDALWPFSLAKITGRKQPKPRGSNVKTTASRGQRLAIGPHDELLVASSHRVADDLSTPWPIERAALTLHDRRGRLLWNRPWPEEDGWTVIHAVHMGDAGAITALVWASGGAQSGYSVVRLDRHGRVLWRRATADFSESVQSVVGGDGNVYLLTQRWFDEQESWLERIDALGQTTGAWSLGALGLLQELHSGRQGAWITNRTDVGFGPELWVLPFDGASGACEGRRYGWPGEWESLFNGALVLAESASADVYVASSEVVLKLPGGAP